MVPLVRLLGHDGGARLIGRDERHRGIDVLVAEKLSQPFDRPRLSGATARVVEAFDFKSGKSDGLGESQEGFVHTHMLTPNATDGTQLPPKSVRSPIIET